MAGRRSVPPGGWNDRCGMAARRGTSVTMTGYLGGEGAVVPLITADQARPKAGGGDVPLFVEHCEAVAAEVDVTLR
jgi:hypothetical protein